MKTVAGIILAGGEGKRMNSKTVNKVCTLFHGKPLILYGVDLLKSVTHPIVIVIGAYADSVKNTLKNESVVYAYQEKRLGTAHAVQMALPSVPLTDLIIVGYGDHMMFYHPEIIRNLIHAHDGDDIGISMVTVNHDDPDMLSWGRIIRGPDDLITGIVEQKDANEQERRTKEVNAGLYCFNTQFLRECIGMVKPSSVSGELYLTDLIKIAVEKGKKITGLKVPFEDVGIGINNQNDLVVSQELHKNNHNW